MRMATCHPERPRRAKGLCEQCYRRDYYATHREGDAVRNRVYRAAHKEQAAARGRAYYAAHKEQAAAYRAAHGEENTAYRTAHREKLAVYGRAYRERPAMRARRFLQRNPDCTSTLEDVTVIYAASIDMTTGLPGKIGLGSANLCLDHIPNGPAVGLIPNWLNHICTKHLDGNLPKVIEHLERRHTLLLKAAGTTI